MNNLLERILVIETLEKIFRLQAFLQKASIRATDPDIKVISIYDYAINEVLKSIQVVIYKLHDNYGDLDENERYSCIRRISNAFNSTDDLHSQLNFIHGEWTIQETYIFIKRLFRFILKDNDDVSIVLSDNYMFEEVDLSRYLEWRLRCHNITARLDEIRSTLFLPKIEYSNPLNWSILVHEMGHVLTKPLEEILSDTEIAEISTTADGIKMLESWTEEIWCDLIATKLLGPSYIASYIIFSILLASSGRIEESSKTHPADRVRISIMRHYLEMMNTNLKIKGMFADFNCVSDFFYDLFERRCTFERSNFIFDLPPPSQFPLNYQKFRDLMVDKIQELTYENMPDLEVNNDKIRRLLKRLCEGILIGSFIAHDKPESLQDELKKIESIINNREAENQNDKIGDLMKHVLNGVKESPCTISEILNTGWLYKCECFYPNIIDLLFSKNEELDQCYDVFRNEIFLLDDKLKKSIEISHIHDLFAEVNESDS